MRNPYPYNKIQRFAMREALVRPWGSWKIMMVVTPLLLIVCPLSLLVMYVPPLLFLRSNDDWRRTPLILFAAGLVLTVVSIVCGVIPVGSMFAAMDPYLHGTPDWGGLLFVWGVQSVWYSSIVIPVAALMAMGRGAAMDQVQERFLYPARTDTVRMRRKMRRAEDELAEATILDATQH